ESGLTFQNVVTVAGHSRPAEPAKPDRHDCQGHIQGTELSSSLSRHGGRPSHDRSSHHRSVAGRFLLRGIWLMILVDLLACHAGRTLARPYLRTTCGHPASLGDRELDPDLDERPAEVDTRPQAGTRS